MGYNNQQGHGGWIFFIFVLIVLIGGGYYIYKTGKITEIKNDILDDRQETIISTPPADFEWCRVQELESSEILGWDSTNECCIQEWEGVDSCLKTTIKVHRCYIGDISTIHKWSRVNGYNLESPADYKGFVDVLSGNNETCQQLTYPGSDDQRLNIENNFNKI